MIPRAWQHAIKTPTFAWVSILLFILSSIWALFSSNGIRYRLDADVYRIGAQRVLDNQELYAGGFHIINGIHLPFTYPPLAAILFIPLTIFSANGVSLAMGILNIAALVLTTWLVMKQVAQLPKGGALRMALILSAFLMLFGPIKSTFDYGQVNLLLAVLIVADFTFVPPKYRGILTGLATAFKLTPAVFGLWLLLRKDWLSVLRMGISTIGFTLLGFLILPRESMKYWLGTIQETDRIGGLGYSSNQSINGELWRLGLSTADGGTLWWLIFVVAALALSALVSLRLFANNLPVLAIGSIALFGLLASPVSWDHHFVWVAIILLTILAYLMSPQAAQLSAHSIRTLWGLFISGIICFALSPRSIAPSGHNLEQDWSVGWHILGNAYLWWSIVALCLLWRISTSPKNHAAL